MWAKPAICGRVRQYFTGHDERVMVPFGWAAVKVEVTEVRTEKKPHPENTLIKKHRPRYNVRLRDDSGFLHLRIDPNAMAALYGDPQLGPEGAVFRPVCIGSSGATDPRVRLSPISPSTCTDEELKRRQRPCLLHQMHRCLAPCANLCTRGIRGGHAGEHAVLEGRNTGCWHDCVSNDSVLRSGEEAARIRDLIRAVESVWSHN